VERIKKANVKQTEEEVADRQFYQPIAQKHAGFWVAGAVPLGGGGGGREEDTGRDFPASTLASLRFADCICADIIGPKQFSSFHVCNPDLH
jgi:hypothetical protein